MDTKAVVDQGASAPVPHGSANSTHADHQTEKPVVLNKLGSQLSGVLSLELTKDLEDRVYGGGVRFERYARFLGTRARNESPWPCAHVVQRRVSDMVQIVMDADRALQAHLSRFDEEVGCFAEAVARNADRHWYRNVGDLTAFDGAAFVELLNKMPVADIRDFAIYLEETLPAAAEQARPDHEYGSMSFARKVHLLVEKVLQSSRADYSIPLSLIAVVKARVLLIHEPRVQNRALQSELDYIDSTLLWLIQQHTDDLIPEQYWNFACPWRMLVNAWEDLATEPGVLLRLLRPMRAKAESEIRYKTRLAVNGRLPAELVDSIFQDALLAEEIPPDTE